MTVQKEDITLRGTGISPGLAMGKAFVYRDTLERELEFYRISVDQVDDEYARIECATEDVLQNLRLSAERVEKQLDASVADIFRAHEEMLRDVLLLEELREELRQELTNAENAVQRVFKRWEDRFRALENETFRQRGDDIADLARRLLRALAGTHTHPLESMPDGSVVVARRLLPSDTVFFSRRSAVAIVVESGGPASHCALLTRQMGIPGVSQISDVVERISTGDVVMVDGAAGTVTVAPHKDTQARFKKTMKRHRKDVARASGRCHEPAVTVDGLTIPVMANISSRRDSELALENGADGVGLYRTEVIFLSRKMLPTEEEMIEDASRTLAPLKEKPITIRLLDVGGDKNLRYLRLPDEPNPFLGRRGVRLLLHYPDLLDLQLRAILRLSQEYDLQILVPMVTVAEDMKQLRNALASAAAKIGVKEIPRLGAMVETPAAALCLEEMAQFSDFFNIGSNDLTQYTMAAGRENPFVYRYFKDDHPAVIRLLRLIGKESGELPLGLCGELAGQHDSIPLLLGAGIRMLSVAPPLVPSVKEAVRCSRAGVSG